MKIKFRGMDLQGNWHYGLPCNITTDKATTPAGWYISNSVGMPFAYEVRPETVSQFTGFKDIKGNDVYENDILLCDDGENRQVVWYELGAGWRIGIDDTNTLFNGLGVYPMGEIVGNIYENPKL